MTSLVDLAWRLARAGGRLRVGAQLGANVLGGFVLALAAALQGAVLTDTTSGSARLVLAAGTGVVLLPLVILLVTVGRLSAATRDRRLASLRVLGLTPARTRTVGALEAGLLAAAGAVVGVLLAIPVAPLSAGWRYTVAGTYHGLPEPFRVTPSVAAGVVVVLVATAGLASVAGTWRLASSPLARRAASTRRLPLPWALAPLGAGLALTAWLAAGMPGTVKTLEPDGAVVGGAVRLAQIQESDVPVGFVIAVCVVLLGVGSAYVPSLVASWCAGILVGTRRTAAVLAGRGMQTEPTSVSRVVASVSVVVLLTTCAAGYLGALTYDEQYRLEELAADGGPISLLLEVDGAVEDDESAAVSEVGRPHGLTAGDVRAATALPRVLAVAPSYMRLDDDGLPVQGSEVFVGTCEQLARLVVVTGCRDDRAAHIVGRGHERAADTSVTLMSHVSIEDQGAITVDVSDDPIVADADATGELWEGVIGGGGSIGPVPFGLFVPTALLGADPPPVMMATLFAHGGPEAAQEVADELATLGVAAHLPDLETYASVQAQRSLLLTFVAWFVGLGCLGIALAAVDRQQERRRTVARLVAVGVPPRTLLAAQAVQVLLPLGAGIVLAAGCGLILVGAVAWSTGTGLGVIGAGVPLFLGVVAGVVTLVPLLTLPAATTRLTPELLREE
ncbi:hypothetical protein HF995_05980 [Sanguibacter hominis ATCC BAA-789]|uniref:ABC3 transporter permease C-terminal domain-containing protein n=1 Tax=Sanguibacter hominis ATCC BAA-789 TaxID=1312740 RepID=A0A9X5IQL9_9MICO|nr:FtsX-like permease family protein [Sanguibacter hominis]NKX92825.1 hypothetical protein [Sanguibacter hominis ATCC BAA-789]